MVAQAQYQLTGTADSTGTCTVTLPGTLVAGTAQIAVGIVYVQTDSANTTNSVVLLNGLPVCATDNGNQDTASDWPPLYVGSKDTLQVQWTGCAQNDQCEAVIYYVPIDSDNTRQRQGQRSSDPTDLWQGR